VSGIPQGVTDLLGRYCELMDAADWGGLGEMFVRGALADEHGNEIARGSRAVAAFYRAGTRLYDGSPRTKHLVSNTTAEEPRDGLIVARSSFLVLQATGDFPLQPIVCGRYRDTFQHDGGAWTFAERRFVVDLAGDLSHHLTYELP
jgi:hypothetical protein